MMKGEIMSRQKFQEIRQALMQRLDLTRELTDGEILSLIDDLILSDLKEEGLSLKEKVELRQRLFHSVRKLDVLQDLLEDNSVTEIMVNGPDSIFVEREGKNQEVEQKFYLKRKIGGCYSADCRKVQSGRQ